MNRFDAAPSSIVLGAILMASAVFSSSAGAAEYVRLTTTKGPIVLELNDEKAPKTVANFLGYVDDGFYEGTVFHRIMPTFMIQGGGMTADGTEIKTKDPIEHEGANGLTNDRYTIAMARTRDPHSATSQFFINVVDNDGLNHTWKDSVGYGYTVFGRVIDGFETVEAIRNVPVEASPRGEMSQPSEQVTITKAERVPADEASALVASADEKRAKAVAAAPEEDSGHGDQVSERMAFAAQLHEDAAKAKTLDRGLMILDIKEGDGAEAKAGDTVSMHYTGWFTDGRKFDSSLNKGTPIEKPLVEGSLIAGWVQGIPGMKVGGKRKLIIPSDLAYGPRGRPGMPGGATLVFEVELLEIKGGESEAPAE